MTHPLAQLPVTPKPRHRRKATVIMAHMDEFLSHVDPTLSPASQRVVRRSLFSMRKFLAGREPTTENLYHWLRHRVATDRVKPATLCLERTYVNRYLEWLIAMDRLERNPLRPIPHVTIPVFNRPTITDEQHSALLRAGEGTFWPYLCTVAWYTGARSSDIVSLRWENVDLANRLLKFQPRKTIKSGQTVELQLNDALLELFTLWHETRIYTDTEICREAKMIHDRADGSFQRQFRYYADKAGWLKTLSFHSYRHTRATRMLNGDGAVNLLVAADFLGLRNLSTLRKYTKTSLASKSQAMNL